MVFSVTQVNSSGNIKWGNKAGTSIEEIVWEKFQQQFSTSVWHTSFLRKSFVCEDTILSLQHDAGISSGLSLCVLKQGQNDLNFQCPIVCTTLANYPYKNEPVSASWAPACALSRRHVSYAYVRKVLSTKLVPKCVRLSRTELWNWRVPYQNLQSWPGFTLSNSDLRYASNYRSFWWNVLPRCREGWRVYSKHIPGLTL